MYNGLWFLTQTSYWNENINSASPLKTREYISERNTCYMLVYMFYRRSPGNPPRFINLWPRAVYNSFFFLYVCNYRVIRSTVKCIRNDEGWNPVRNCWIFHCQCDEKLGAQRLAEKKNHDFSGRALNSVKLTIISGVYIYSPIVLQYYYKILQS